MFRFAAPLRLALDSALPPRCPACGAIVASDHSLCGECWSSLRFLGPPWCAACHAPFDQDRGEDALCARCMEQPPRHDGVRAAVAYGEVARGLAVRLKHGGRTGIAVLVARLMQRHADVPDALLVPVPLHRWRIWGRGFNQAALIARAIGRMQRLEVAVDALRRVKRTPMLGGLGRDARAKALRGAIRVNPAAQIKGRTILLVDDVHTSGATADACTRALKRAGAKRVIVLAWARVLHSGDD
ncbi:ComF family protein [Sphingomonas gilva]|uniref:ComF family protein n=2 Tax=Sphingomonas gilva TaxID=2305907 RepID=A0A396RRZ9_9SPHN|nr:ComF family protein [Sphingomonas gilva]RHW17093.1 ComF family protein [Sphingomonas gilva]